MTAHSRRRGDKSPPFFARLLKLFDEVPASVLPPLYRWILAALAEYASPDGRDIFPELATIAKRCGMSRAALCRRMRELETAGWLVRERRRHDGHQTSTYYTVRLGGAAIVPVKRKGHAVIPKRVSKAERDAAGVADLGAHRARIANAPPTKT